MGIPRQDLYRLCHLYRSNDIDYRSENSRGITSGGNPCWRQRFKDTPQARRFKRNHRHGKSVAANRSAIDPRNVVFYGNVIDQEAGFEVVGCVQDTVGPLDELFDILVIHVCD